MFVYVKMCKSTRMDHICIDSAKAFSPSGVWWDQKGREGSLPQFICPAPAVSPSTKNQLNTETPCPPVKTSSSASCCSLLDSTFCVQQVGDKMLDIERCASALTSVFHYLSSCFIKCIERMINILALETTNLNQETLKKQISSYIFKIKTSCSYNDSYLMC